MPEKQYKGRIRWMPEVHCGKCGRWDQLPEAETGRLGRLSLAQDVAETAGWNLTSKHGWLCPECVKELRAKEGV